MKFVLLRLRTEETIIGKMSIKDEQNITIVDAARVHMQFTDASSVPGVFFTKYCLYNESFDVTFDRKDVMHIFYDPLDTMISYYNEQIAIMKARYKDKRWETERRQPKQDIEDWKALFEKFRDDPEVH